MLALLMLSAVLVIIVKAHARIIQNVDHTQTIVVLMDVHAISFVATVMEAPGQAWKLNRVTMTCIDFLSK